MLDDEEIISTSLIKLMFKGAVKAMRKVVSAGIGRQKQACRQQN